MSNRWTDKHIVLYPYNRLLLSNLKRNELLGFPGSSDGKESACKCGRFGFDPWVRRSPGGHINPLQYSCLENPHGQRSRRGALWSMGGHKESDMTEWLRTAHSIHTCNWYEWISKESCWGEETRLHTAWSYVKLKKMQTNVQWWKYQ